jgi:hypothetical protein
MSHDWHEVPDDIFATAATYLDAKSLLSFSLTCKSFSDALDDENTWKHLALAKCGEVLTKEVNKKHTSPCFATYKSLFRWFHRRFVCPFCSTPSHHDLQFQKFLGSHFNPCGVCFARFVGDNELQDYDLTDEEKEMVLTLLYYGTKMFDLQQVQNIIIQTRGEKALLEVDRKCSIRLKALASNEDWLNSCPPYKQKRVQKKKHDEIVKRETERLRAEAVKLVKSDDLDNIPPICSEVLRSLVGLQRYKPDEIAAMVEREKILIEKCKEMRLNYSYLNHRMGIVTNYVQYGSTCFTIHQLIERLCRDVFSEHIGEATVESALLNMTYKQKVAILTGVSSVIHDKFRCKDIITQIGNVLSLCTLEEEKNPDFGLSGRVKEKKKNDTTYDSLGSRIQDAVKKMLDDLLKFLFRQKQYHEIMKFYVFYSFVKLDGASKEPASQKPKKTVITLVSDDEEEEPPPKKKKPAPKRKRNLSEDSEEEEKPKRKRKVTRRAKQSDSDEE